MKDINKLTRQEAIKELMESLSEDKRATELLDRYSDFSLEYLKKAVTILRKLIPKGGGMIWEK